MQDAPTGTVGSIKGNIIMDDDMKLFATFRQYWDGVEHAIQDKNWIEAVDRLEDCKRVIQTLSGFCQLPESCKCGFSEIWK